MKFSLVKELIPFIPLAFLVGCATPSTMLINPNTGVLRNCAATGWGWAGAPLAIMSHDSCVKSFRSAGFVPMGETTPFAITIDSVPAGAEIYSGRTKENISTLSGTTPISRTTGKGIFAWSTECYQARKDGYEDSEVKCFEQVAGDRAVSFRLKKAGSHVTNNIADGKLASSQLPASKKECSEESMLYMKKLGISDDQIMSACQ